jgi:aspartyl-tRNA(Asn)/glutamyl-tRNA(Gln) amidotransferase subunit C
MRHIFKICRMSVDLDTVKRVARLARIAIDDDSAQKMQSELNNILVFVEQLNEVYVADVEPMTSVVDMTMKKRVDVVDDGNRAVDVIANAPLSEDGFFVVPKVVE